MSEGVLWYKCRACGKVHRCYNVPDVMAALVAFMRGEQYQTDYQKQAHQEGIYSISTHSCADGKIGLSDCVGGQEQIRDFKPIC